MTGTDHVTIIAEAGVNHNGSTALARQLVDAAVAAGADIIKFQTFTAEKLAAPDAPKAAYQEETTGCGESQLDMLRALELSADAHRELFAYCQARGIEFLSTPFDADNIDLLTGLGVARLKIPSGDITNGPLLLKAGQTGLPLIISTGMATLPEIDAALGVAALGHLGTADKDITPESFSSARHSEAGQAYLLEKVTLLHCTTEYPAPFEDVNLRAMATMAEAFGLPVGYSDHTTGLAVAIAATARGAAVIEKHFTMDRSLPGPDHRASLEPAELAELVRCVREVEMALGSPAKAPSKRESKNMAVIRKSVVAAADIASGEVMAPGNLAVMRPSNGRSPMEYWSLLGVPAARPYKRYEPI